MILLGGERAVVQFECDDRRSDRIVYTDGSTSCSVFFAVLKGLDMFGKYICAARQCAWDEPYLRGIEQISLTWIFERFSAASLSIVFLFLTTHYPGVGDDL